MDAESLIRDDAMLFSKHLRSYEHEHNGPQKFKDELCLELYNYYEELDKLIYLYEVSKQIDYYHDLHLTRCNFTGKTGECPTSIYYYKTKYFIEQEIRALNPSLDYSILRPNINSDLLRDNLVKLKEHPEAANAFQSALDNLNESKFDRNLLDDLRLSLECLLKSVLNNSAPLEKQKESLGTFLKQSGTSKEVTNMFNTLIAYYCSYQNEYIKHNVSVKEDEIDLTVNLTAAFISFLLNKG